MRVTAVAEPLAVAVRVWATPHRSRGQGRSRVAALKHWLVFDAETTTDATQALTFGAARYLRVDPASGALVAVAEIFHADDLPQRDPDGFATLQTFAAEHRAEVNLLTQLCEPQPRLLLISRDQFVRNWLVPLTYRRAKPVGTAGVALFNAPFDPSRIAVTAEAARERSYTPKGRELPQWDGYYGGFTFTLLCGEQGEEAAYTPRVRIKTIDNKRALKGYTHTEPARRDRSRGHFLDLRTAVFALTGADHNLRSAGEAFNASILKNIADGHGLRFSGWGARG